MKRTCAGCGKPLPMPFSVPMHIKVWCGDCAERLNPDESDYSEWDWQRRNNFAKTQQAP